MFKCEIIFNGDNLYCKGRRIFKTKGIFYDYWEVDGTNDTFRTREEAIRYCMNN